MHTNTERLRELMAQHNLKAADVADLLGREPNTIRVWRMKETHRVIPGDALRLLELLLAGKDHE